MASQTPSPVQLPAFCILAWLTLLLASPLLALANNSSSDRTALMAFKASVDVAQKLGSWSGANPCSGRWHGVSCKKGRVSRLVLEGLQLSGTIDSLIPLDQLRILSLENNALNGSLPTLTSWGRLKFLYLSENEFSGSIPDSISSLFRLCRLDLSNNNLSGSIPPSLNLLSKLLTLRLQNNRFSGMLPNLNATKLHEFNVSDNQLTGAVPQSLANFSISSFLGNADLCGVPLLVCDTSQPSNPGMLNPMVVSSSPSSKPASPNERKRAAKLGIGAVVAIVVGDAAAVVLVTCIFILHYWRKYNEPAPSKMSKKLWDSEKLVFSSLNNSVQKSTDADKGRLVFVDQRKGFKLEELLRASAEMLGKGSFGTAYKAVLADGSVFAVKRLKDVNSVGRREFEQQMELIGRMRHPNLVCLRAYHYSREEKFVVYDYLKSGNLHAFLHGNRGPGRTPLDWTVRMKIALGAARGLAYIHQGFSKSQRMPHGNLKSSNVLLDRNGNACISEVGLAFMVSPSVVASRLVGYRAPELIETKKVSQRADVYSYGVVLLEILTGKEPAKLYTREGSIDLPKWVESMVQKDRATEVFDLELVRYKNNREEEMMGMLEIAMGCVCVSPEQRLKMSQVVKMIENITGEQSPQKDSWLDSPPSLSPSVSDETSTSF